jgi:hypothetical protein
MEARNIPTRIAAGGLAAALVTLPVTGLLNLKSPAKGRPLLDWVGWFAVKEIYFIFAVFLVFSCLYYWVGPKAWIEKVIGQYLWRVVLLTLGFSLILLGWLPLMFTP